MDQLMKNDSSEVSLDDVTSLYDEIQTEASEKSIEELKVELSYKAEEIKILEDQLLDLEAKGKTITDRINILLEEVRRAWAPFIKGVDKASLEFPNGLSLEAKNKTSISKEDEDAVIHWLTENKYEGAMKWQIHHKTLEKIALDHYSRGESIDGLTYKSFTTIKVK